jgi:DNA repair photolyase
MEPIGHITRKTMLYQTKVEYGDWAVNHVQGCMHGCQYPCYAFLMARRFGRVKTYDEWLRPSIVDNTIDLLRKELPRHKDEIERVRVRPSAL